MYLSPSDPAEMMLNSQGISVSTEVLESTREELGLNKSFTEQYTYWVSNMLKGDMGKSYSTQRSVITELKEHMPYTIMLTLSSIIITLLISIPLGILCALKKNTITDYIIRVCTFVGNSIPGFFVGLILLFVFALKLRILPVLSESGMKSIILPSVTLAISMSSRYIRQIREVVMEELDKDYVKGAYSRGVPQWKIIYRHVLRNILITVITLIGLSVGSLLGGSAIIENIFVWPGLGSLALNAVKARDYPLVQGYVMWTAIIFIIINLIVDFIYGILDPRTIKNRRN
ncbi:MAG: ABC transporter permease [Clostridium sp.]|uniref:Nickel import system permease protein NikB n=2 Tax=Clostridium butyricum TaxID=1492 RepID=A0A2S7F9N3_CLOBU|nr:binding--dependent transport system inner membrane component family protein [Clostridium butyricum]MBS4840433.1 ABC transporter permease [Clostridium sp.]PPV14209.1 nickel ABC transporter permease subunit NikB [Clostridium butyricum]